MAKKAKEATAPSAIDLRWDAFLPERNRRQVEAFRQREWPQIERALVQDFRLVVGPEQEPHWVSPGSAVYWHQPITRVRVQDSDPTVGNRIEEQVGEWEPVSRDSGLPASSASAIAHYLQRPNPLFLRPQAVGASVLAAQEAQVPTVVSEVKPNYACKRHGQSMFSFPTWTGYLRHCRFRQEVPELPMPPEIEAMVRTVPYYCQLCGVSFQTERMAAHHIKTMPEKHTGVIAAHAFLYRTVESMKSEVALSQNAGSKET